MTIGEAIGIKNNMGWGTSLLDITATDYIGQTLTITDADGNQIASKTVPADGKLSIPTDKSGMITLSVGTFQRKQKITYYGTYRINFSEQVIYTLRIDTSNSNPSTSCVYLDDCEGFTPAYMDYVGGAFDYGSWEDAFFMPRPCMVASDGAIDYFLDPDDYTKKADGTASDIADTTYDGNVFSAIPTVWIKITEESGYIYISVTNKQTTGYDAFAHHDHSGNIMPYAFLPVYNGSLVSSKLRSLSGQTPMVSQTATNERTYAQANGDIYDIETFSDRNLLTVLCYLIGKSLDTQTVFGMGRCNASNMISTGTMNDKGLFWGATDGTSGVKVFGVENPWGNIYHRIVGLMASANTIYTKLTYGTEDGSSVTGYNLTASGYVSVGTMGGTNGGYISKMKASNNALYPQTASGSSSTYYCDGLYYTTSGGTYMALVGGGWDGAALCGAAFANLSNAPSNADGSGGAALSCKPLA